MKEITILDSNCYTYLLEAMSFSDEPPEFLALRDEKVSLLRLYLYSDMTFAISDTVRNEYLKIRQPTKLKLHESTNTCLLETISPDIKKVIELVEIARKKHNSRSDCKIWAEAVLAQAAYLITCDKKLAKRLADLSLNTIIISPIELFNKLKIPKKSEPKILPHCDNPLSKLNFWKV
jgi:predicted nucleic acid-binding protein